MINTFVHLMIQKIKQIFRLSNTARKIFCVARIFDATVSNFTNGRAIAPPAPLSPTPMPTVLDVEAEQKRNWSKTKYYPALDALISECSQRFSSELMGIAYGVDAFCNVNFQGSKTLIRHYANLLSLDLDLGLALEVSAMLPELRPRPKMNLLRAMLPDGPLSTAMKTQTKEELLKGLYPNFCKLYRVGLCISVGTATCERSFSVMRRIRNYLRVTMGQERFSNFGLLNIENDITTKVDSDNNLNQFASVASHSLMFSLCFFHSHNFQRILLNNFAVNYSFRNFFSLLRL